MHMTFEKINNPIRTIPDPQEHPAARAGRIIKELHEDNVKLIDDGFVFTRDGVDVSQEMRAKSLEQIKFCDDLIHRAPSMDPGMSELASALAEDAVGEHTRLKAELIEAKAKVDAATERVAALEDKAMPELPEVGDYEHKKT